MFEVDNRKGHEVLVMVLAGYKPDLWDKVFDRFIKYMDLPADVCIVSSGLQNERLAELARQNGWSYMSTSVNNLCLAQNECIELHSKAKYIFKMDEDVFVTAGSFRTLIFNFRELESDSDYVPGAIVPMINVNATTFIQVLRFQNKLAKFTARFGLPKVSDGRTHHDEITFNEDVCKFLWDEVDIDDKSKRGSMRTPVFTRFSIGLVLFTREVWLNMGKFPVDLENSVEYKRIGLGEDEKALCGYCFMKAYPMFIDETVLVGHLSYGPQTKAMMEYFKTHPEKF